MTDSSTGNSSFTSYYDKYRSRFGSQQSQSVDFSQYSGLFTPSKQKLGFLGRFADILSRPMRILSNPAMKIVELPEQLDKAKELRLSGQDAAATKQTLNAVGSVLASPFTGFFSDDPANKPYWSDIIERAADVQNRNNPNYVDKANNVDPMTKGALGFVGDVLIDPLWLVPGGWAAKAGAKAGKEASAAVDVSRRVARGELPEAAMLPSTSNIQRLGVTETAFSQTARETFDLTTIVGGKTRTQNYATREAAEQALQKSQARSKKPWVNLDETAKPFRGTNGYKISSKAVTQADVFPAAQAAQKVADDLVEAATKGGATSSETVVKSLREIINTRQVALGKETVGLRGELDSFFKSLAKAAPTPRAKPGKAQAFGKWVESAATNKNIANSVLAVPEGSVLSQPMGRSTTVKNAIALYRDTRRPEIKRAIEQLLLRPAYNNYASGVKAGKGVDLLGNASTPTARVQEAAEASIAATIVRNLKNLDDAERARGAALLGEELFADLQALSPKQMAKFIDDIDAVLLETGAVDALGVVNPQTLLGRVLGLFDDRATIRAAEEARLAASIDNIPNVTPEVVAARAVDMGESAEMTDFVTSLFNRAGITENVGSRVLAIKAAVAEVLPNLARAKLDEKYQKGVYPYESKSKKALKTDPDFGTGRAVVPKSINSGFQAEAFKDLQIALAKYYKADAADDMFLGFAGKKEFRGQKFIREKERNTLIALELLEELLKRQGLAPTLTLDGVSYQMGLAQAYRIVSETMGDISHRLAGAVFNAFSPVGPKGTRKAAELFDGTLPPNVFADAVAKKLAGGSAEDIKAILLSKLSAAKVPIVNGFADAYAANRKVRTGNTEVPVRLMADEIVKGIDEAGPALIRALAENAEQYTIRGLVEGKQFTAEAAEIIADVFANAEKTAAQIRIAANPSKIVEDIATVVPSTELGQTFASGVITASIGPEVRKTAQVIEEISEGVASGNKARVKKAQETLIDDAANASQRIMDDATRIADDLRKSGNPYDDLIDDVIDELDLSSVRRWDAAATQGRGTVTAGAMKLIDPLRRFFDAKSGMNVQEMLWGSRLFFAQGNLMALVNKPFIKSLNALSKNDDYTKQVIPGAKTTVLQQAMKNVQQGIRSAEGSALRNAEDELRPLLARFFDQTDEVQNLLLGNAFFRTGAGRESINSVLEYAAVLGRGSNDVAITPPKGIYFDEDLAVKLATEKAEKLGRAPTRSEITEELLNQWKSWEINDPLDFLFRTNRAMVQLASEVSFVTAFRQKAFQLGLASSKPRNGFVKVVGGSDSRYGRFLGEEPLYMDRDAAEMFQAIDNFAKTSKQFDGSFGKFVRTTLDPLTDTWKYAITLPRPGHHIRNMIGDITLTFLAEGVVGAAIASRNAWKMMSLRGTYSDVDVAKAMTQMGISDIPKNTSVVSSGRFGSLTYDDVYRELFLGKGILIPARQREGLLTRQTLGKAENNLMDDEVIVNTASRALEKTFAVTSLGFAARGGRMEDAILTIAEGRDTFVRMQHAFQMLEKAQQGKILTRGFGTTVDPKKISKDELYDLIAERVSKYHPDMATLSTAEKKYLRRLMPFYHWNRGAVQAVLETLVMNPGRVTVFDKATYNIAVAAGINPDSLYDPFPDDQLFPSFLREQIQGPLFEADNRYFGFRPGIVTQDVLNQFASGNPIDVILDNANPAFKIPIELLTGTRLGTQSRIRDYSDFIDSSIPGMNYVANVSGKSVTGSFYSLLTGGGFDPQYQFEVGNKDSRDQIISAVNWLLGIGLTDYSRPSYIRFAEIEQQQQNREGRGF
jgi:hypothetical protein